MLGKKPLYYPKLYNKGTKQMQEPSRAKLVSVRGTPADLEIIDNLEPIERAARIIAPNVKYKDINKRLMAASRKLAEAKAIKNKAQVLQKNTILGSDFNGLTIEQLKDMLKIAGNSKTKFTTKLLAELQVRMSASEYLELTQSKA